MEITVTKHTGLEELRRAASTTIHKESNLTLARCYAMEHSPMRTQVFTVEMRGIPQFVANHLVRHKIGCEWFMQSKRPDRGGKDFIKECGEIHAMLEDMAKEVKDIADTEDSVTESYYNGDFNALLKDLSAISEKMESMPKEFDRNAPTDLTGFLNAEAILNISRKRLCCKASPVTQEVWNEVVTQLSFVDPDLAAMCVPQCVHRGGICPEKPSCGYAGSECFETELEEYRKHIAES